MTRLTMWCQRLAQRTGLTGAAAAVFLGAPLVAWIAGWNVGNAVVFGTGVVVLLYTYETYQMRWQLVRQNEIAIHPLVLATVKFGKIDGGTEAWRVVLRNIGRGPALFVRVDDFGGQENEQNKTVRLSRIPPVDCIEPGKDKELPVEVVMEEEGIIEVLRNGGYRGWNFVAKLNPGSATETYVITVRYEDIDRRKYWAKIQMGKGGIRLLDHGQEFMA
jgi:hypothetical protein